MKSCDHDRLKRILAVGICLSGIVPVVFFALSSMGQVRTLALDGMEQAAQRSVERGANDLHAFLHDKTVFLTTLMRLHPVEHLQKGENLDALFQALGDKGHPGEIVGLELLDADGIALARAGQIQETDAPTGQDAAWLRQALAHGIAFDDVGAGRGNGPALIIALAHPDQTAVLRATVKAQVLDDLLLNSRIGPLSRATLLNARGEVLAASPGKTVAPHAGAASLADPADNAERGFFTSKRIGAGNWTLVLHPDPNDYLGTYYKYCALILVLALVSTAGIALMAAGVLRAVSQRLKRLDDRQNTMYKQQVIQEKMTMAGMISTGIVHDLTEPLLQAKQHLDKIHGQVGRYKIENINLFKNIQYSIDRIDNNILRIRTVLDRLLRFSHLSRIQESGDRVQVNWILREILSFLATEASEHNIALTMELEESLPSVWTNGSQVQQLLLSLVESALEAVGSDGRVHCATYSTSDEVHVQIADSSSGITSERMKQLWQPFFTGPEPDDGKGAGLDLSLYSAIVYKLGGRISAQDRPQGGALVTFSLPVPG
ncbi:ATP-binding protein [Desulfobulbus sp.]|uniref:sensor histidine kinase n=1 Tax=Desulfobulbus sp. TaxID=895 RepID=UPI00286EBD01|nr:ATP-binding protein [Desulfobulbus sp.]